MSGLMWSPQGMRIPPRMRPDEMQTYSISSPRSTHFRPATCAEVECLAYTHGWVTTVDEATDLGQAQAYHIRKVSGRKYAEVRLPSGLTEFTFEAGQVCFAQEQHVLPVGRPEIYTVTGGDWRGNPRGTPTRRHVRAEDWAEDFALHQDKLNDTLRKG